MSDASKRKGKRKSPAQNGAVEDPCKLTPSEEAVAKALLWELPSREGKLAGMMVRIFFANEALEFLLKSRFATAPQPAAKEPVIKDEKSAVQLLSCLMAKGLFQRAAKVHKDKSQSSSSSSRPGKARIKDKDKDKDKDKEAPVVDEESAAAREKREERRQKEREEKRKRGRPKLEIHEDQAAFSPGPNDVYIWHYDPTRPRNVVLGFLMVLGSILICLFPMWPLELRTGTYYLSISALCLLGGLIGLALMRFPLFGLIWCLTWGRVYFWFLPNLTEDVGVLESFVPVVSFRWAAGGAAAASDIPSCVAPQAAAPVAGDAKKTD